MNSCRRAERKGKGRGEEEKGGESREVRGGEVLKMSLGRTPKQERDGRNTIRDWCIRSQSKKISRGNDNHFKYRIKIKSFKG